MPIQQMLLGNPYVYDPQVITDDLETYYDFGNSSCWNGSSTTINDLTSNNYNATLTGNSSNYSQSSSNGGYLDLTNTHATDKTIITRSDNNIISTIGTSDYTIEFWINIDMGEDGGHVSNANSQMFKSAPTSAQNFRIAWTKAYFSTTRMRLSPAVSGSGWDYIDSFGSYSDGYAGWMHLVFSRIGTSSNNMKGYLNNQLKHTWTQTTNWNASEDSSLSWRGYSFGDAGDVNTVLYARFAVYRLYIDKGFTASDVSNNYNAEKARFGLS